MVKAIWFFADGSYVTLGATGDLFALIFAGHKIAARKKTTLIGWRFR